MIINVNLFDNNLGDRQYNIIGEHIQMTYLEKFSSRFSQYKCSAMYILLGPKMARQQIYIGQTTNLYQRILKHRKLKDFWEAAIFFTHTDRQFTKTEIEFFESMCIINAINNNCFDLIQNYQVPTNVIVNEKNLPELNNFLILIKLLLDVFGCPIMRKNDVICDNSQQTSKTFIDRIIKAYTQQPINDDFCDYQDEEVVVTTVVHDDVNASYYDIGTGQIIISKGSRISNNTSNSQRVKILKKHRHKINNNVLIQDILVDNERIAKIMIG